MQRLFLLLCCFLIGCVEQQWSNSPEIWEKPEQVFLCTHIPEQQFFNAESATEQWNKAIGNWRHINIVRSEEAFNISCDYQMYEVKESFDGLKTTLAWADKIGGDTIFLVRGRYESFPIGIMMHEIGHVLGAQHFGETLMHPQKDVIYYSCPDHVTVSQVAAWNHVNLAGLRWCK